jgi:hypothetical protein
MRWAREAFRLFIGRLAEKVKQKANCKCKREMVQFILPLAKGIHRIYVK